MVKKLNLGCGLDIRGGYINVDLTPHTKGIVEQDLNKSGWGKRFFPCIEILASDLIGHLDSPVHFMNECWDALVEEGILKIKACGWQNPNYWVDITHKRAFDIKSFDYFDSVTDLGKRYSYYTDKRWKVLDRKYDRKKNVRINLNPIK